MKRILFLALLLLIPVSANAANQSLSEIRRAVQQFVTAQTAGLPGEVSVEVGAIDPNLGLPACPALEPFLAERSRLTGNTTVGVKCEGKWSIYVPVRVRVIAPVVISARPLGQGMPIGPADVLMRKMDLAESPPGVLTDPAQAVGKTLNASIPSGYPIAAGMLRAPVIIRPGQSVKIVSGGKDFQVTSEGVSLGSAAEGQPVQVRTPAGTVVSGTARPGPYVEVTY